MKVFFCLRLNLYLLFTFLLISCGKKNFTQSSDLKRIIGENNLVKVYSDEKNLQQTQAIGIMKLGCTVSHLGAGYAVTAGHCFTKHKIPGKYENETCADSRYDILWGYTINSEVSERSSCQKIVLLEHNDLKDYALFKVEPVPLYSLKIAKKKNILLNSLISIISHPRKRTQEWSTWCTVENYLSSSGPRRQFLYSCDTEKGSSGAPILDSSFNIIGIHNFYNAEFELNGATDIHNTEIPEIVSMFQK